MIGLYLHIPFCARKCAYCDFCSFPAGEETTERYVAALVKEIALAGALHIGEALDTVFVGGGTPTLLAPRQLFRVFEAVDKAFVRGERLEFTVEANPATVTAEHLQVFRDGGVTRVSLGLQAAQNPLLRRLGRLHTFEAFLETYRAVRNGGPWAVNVDLMYHLPGQTRQNWLDTLDQVTALEPEHLSCYSLQLEEGTPLAEAVDQGRYRLTSDRNDRWMHHQAIDRLTALGYEHYEISNFARPGHHCRHNLRYWLREPYLGLGLSAHSFEGRRRLSNPSDLEAYLRAVGEDRLPAEVLETLTEEEACFEAAMLGLRLSDGLEEQGFLGGCPEGLAEAYRRAFEDLTARKLLERQGGRLRLTRLGMDLSNTVFSELMTL